MHSTTHFIVLSSFIFTKFNKKRTQSVLIRVLVETEKYERFAYKVQQNGTSIYALVNEFIDDYLAKAGE